MCELLLNLRPLAKYEEQENSVTNRIRRYKQDTNERDLKLLQRCKWDPCSSGLLRSMCWFLFTDVSGEIIGPIFPLSSLELTARPSKMGPISCVETSVNNYQRTLRNNSEVWGPQETTYFGQVLKRTLFGGISFFQRSAVQSFI